MGLEIQNLSGSYNDKVKQKLIFNNFNLTVPSGELLVILGPSGCGKSTLLKLISGLKKPDNGKIIFNNKNYFNKDENINLMTEKRNIGYVFQSYALWPHLNIEQNIKLPLKAKKMKKKDIKKKVDEILEVVHLSKYSKSYPYNLSGGEQQRVALARAISYNPEILLLDEPLANLDSNLKSNLVKEIKAIQRKFNITTIYVTHDQNEAFLIADRIIVMDKGKIMQEGTPKQVYKHSNNRFVAEFVGCNNIFQTNTDSCPFCNLKNLREKNFISIRPEDISIVKDGEYFGYLKHIFYKGSHTEYTLKFNNKKLIIITSNTYDLVVGQKVSFNILNFNLFNN